LMYWSALKYACDAGFCTFDFGRSTHGEGTFKFKQQWGAEPEQSYWYYWLNEGQPLPQLNPGNPKYRLAIDIWRKLPVPLTKIIGPRIVRNIP
ncbi:MAG: peptidoglycan bridge formation protein FemAB, partial [Rhodocyclaceae bacterium]